MSGHLTVMICAKFYSNNFVVIRMRSEQNFHRIWITRKMSLAKWDPRCRLLQGRPKDKDNILGKNGKKYDINWYADATQYNAI